MENITTRNNIITDLEQYIDEGPFFDPETKKQEFWLHNLPENEDLFNIIELLREKYYNENFIFIINQKIEIKKITINRNIDLSNCVFKHEVYFENDKKIFLDSIHFHKTIFNSNITFFYSKFYLANFKDIDLQGNEYITFAKCSLEKVEFHNVNFRGNIQFDQSEMKDVSFKNCTFKGNTDFRKVSFKGKSEFLNCTFDSSEDNSTEMVNFSNSTFEQEANFSGSIFNLKADFSETIFGIEKEGNNSEKSSSEVKFLIENAKFQKKVDFSKAIFYDAIYFSGTEFCTDIEDYAKKSINFENAQFKRKVRFHHCKFYNTVRFENTSFNKLVDFYCAHFYKPQQFHFTDFLDRAIFSNTEFDKEIQFLHCRVESNSYIRFESANFKKGLDISRSNFNDKVNFWNIELEEGDAFTSSKYQNDFRLKAKTESTKNTPSIYKKIRETYRIIKSNFYSQNNKIEGLKFYEKEMSAYLEENRNKKDNSENYSSKKKEVNDSLLLKKCLTNKIINRLFTLLLIFLYLPFCMFIILLSPIYITAILIHKITNIDTKNTLYFIINFIFLGLYIFTKDLIWYILFAPQYIYNILYSIPNLKRSISYSIKENNYISLIILSICLVSILVAVYGIPNQNNYILLWEGKILSFNNNILTFISYISLIIIALLFVIIFKKNEKILLWFNKNSNNFGTNWFIGLNFTTLVALITYVVISLLSSNVILQFDAEGVGNFLKGLVKIINVTEWSDITFLEQELTNWQYIFLFIGRIFIGYGYYQTIQAFRKFGKS